MEEGPEVTEESLIVPLPLQRITTDVVQGLCDSDLYERAEESKPRIKQATVIVESEKTCSLKVTL